VTHGHIRRVQRSAVALAQALGVTDEGELRAIEAAALLHDIGKLAVPEHILSKPTSLTPAEFDKMKRHANIGADILASVNFPFPIVPIVRYHHENWDGTGYPDGLRGDAIPLGARILSVVDCFDAITSDRPYRCAMPHDEAIRILRSRMGTMYEPRLVERFIQIQPELAMHRAFEAPAEAFDSIGRIARAVEEGPSQGRRERDMLAATFELGAAITAAPTITDALSRSHATLKRLMPAATCVLFVYNRGTDELAAAFASGIHSDAILGLSIPRGQRLTGWVAAQRQAIVNSDAALDLGNLIVKLRPTPQTCLSVPVCSGEELLGVLTIYSTQPQPFTEMNTAVAEVVALGLASRLAGPPRQSASDKALTELMSLEAVGDAAIGALASSLGPSATSKPC
jgi:putative nucleotidyltransferase with HDIG domain